jgi:ADP-ribosyl-[dinitrogen reductase] hydrolase
MTPAAIICPFFDHHHQLRSIGLSNLGKRARMRIKPKVLYSLIGAVALLTLAIVIIIVVVVVLAKKSPDSDTGSKEKDTESGDKNTEEDDRGLKAIYGDEQPTPFPTEPLPELPTDEPPPSISLPFSLDPAVVRVNGVTPAARGRWCLTTGLGHTPAASLFVEYPGQVCAPLSPADVHLDALSPFEQPYCAVRAFVSNPNVYDRSKKPLPQGMCKDVLRKRFRGALLGMLIGDAMGESCEGLSPGDCAAHMATWKAGVMAPNSGRRQHMCVPGDFTDDGSQGLLMAKSLIDNRGLDGRDLFNLYTAWYHHGVMSSERSYFGIGQSTLQMFDQDGCPFVRANVTDAGGNARFPTWGNGCIMRLAPVPMFFALFPEKECADASAASSLSSHMHHSCAAAARYVAQLMWHFFRRPTDSSAKLPTNGLELRRDLEAADKYKRHVLKTVAKNLWPEQRLMPDMARLYDDPEKAEVHNASMGYSLSAHGVLNFVLRAMWDEDGFEATLRRCISYAQDSDTSAAILGMILGALYGEDGIPRYMRQQVYAGPVAERLADLLLELALDPNVELQESDVLVLNDAGTHLQVRDVNPTRLPRDLWYTGPLPDPVPIVDRKCQLAGIAVA